MNCETAGSVTALPYLQLFFLTVTTVSSGSCTGCTVVCLGIRADEAVCRSGSTMALSLRVFNFFHKFRLLVFVILCFMVLWATFSYLVDSRQQISKAKSMMEDFRKLPGLWDSRKEKKIESVVTTPTVKSLQSHCPVLSPYLQGASKLTFKASLTVEEVQKENPEVVKGRYHPSECSALQRVAIIIPHRSREKHLLYLLEHLHPFLQRQQLDYGIYVIHQAGSTKFNRAKLLNVGYLEALKEANWDCFIFHDVDLLPENDFNIYMCDTQPKHLVVGRNNTGYRFLVVIAFLECLLTRGLCGHL